MQNDDEPMISMSTVRDLEGAAGLMGWLLGFITGGGLVFAICLFWGLR